MKGISRIPTEPEAIQRLKRGAVAFPPLSIRLVDMPGRSDAVRYDAIVEAVWSAQRYLFALEYRSRSTPKVFGETLARMIVEPCLPGTYPMLMTPFLSSQQLSELEQREISGIDLCGNGIIIVPGELCVFRTGQPNRYPQSGPIKNIYRGRSSLVPRVFLARPEYGEVNEVKREIEARNGRIALSTISKSLTTLTEDLLIVRDDGSVRLLQADALLDKLAANYVAPRTTGRFIGRWEGEPDALLPRLFDKVGRAGVRAIISGVSSVGRYAVMAREKKVQVYCSSIDTTARAVGEAIQETSRFPNVELIETDDDYVYFDARPEAGIRYACPVQTYLELMAGDKRDRETAEQVKRGILAELPAPRGS
ncbi:MAG: hypothetical protein JXA69_00800 [Phycisphaerae bacterium]|nr:hypothetical protein [Phycisphaerae bacterium]